MTQTADTIVPQLRVVIQILTQDGTIIPCNAIWDTGASQTTISKKIASDLKLPVISMQEVHTASGKEVVTLHNVGVVLPNNVGFRQVLVAACNLVEPIEGLVGMDIIACGDFAISNFDNKTTVSFRIPSCVKTDYVELSKMLEDISHKKTPAGRNDLCPCGSGRKFKNCCERKR